MPKSPRGNNRTTKNRIRKRDNRKIIFTIASSNYIAYAATLMQSVRRHHPDTRRIIVLADVPRKFPDLDLAAELVECQQLAIPLMENMALWYSVLEFNTAIKPYAFLNFLNSGAKAICFLDPDIYLYRPMREVFTALRSYEAVLIPHLLEPQGDQKEPSDLTILKSGVYNLGFLAVQDTPKVRGMLRWWADRTYAHCRARIAENMFTDQRWMDIAPCFLTRPMILRHPGYNVAYWNMAHRNLRRSRNRWIANDGELIFFHFSGFDPNDPERFSKHQNRLTYRDLGHAARLVDTYREHVLANGWRQSHRIPYGFSTFGDGRKIESPMRQWLLRAIDDGSLVTSDPVVLTSDFFDQPDPLAASKGANLTRFMYQFWLDRSDLRAAFDIFKPDEVAAFYNWFEKNGRNQGLSRETVRAIKRHRQAGRAHNPTHPPKPLWRSLAQSSWGGAASDALTYLSGDVFLGKDGFCLPSQLALLWERRSDLQDRFDLQEPSSLQDYLAWGLTEGVAQKAVDPDLLSEAFIEYFCDMSALSARYDDVPITRGMLITQSIAHRQDLLQAGTRFPAEAKGRIAQGLWFAFVAPKMFHWPESLVKPVRAYFQQLTEVRLDGLRLTRGALAVWELHRNLQQSFPLIDDRSVMSYCCWLLFDGLPQLGLTLDDLDPRFRYFLAHRSPRNPDLNRLSEMVHGANPDLHKRFSLTSDADRAALSLWVERFLSKTYPHLVAAQSRRSSLARDRAIIGLTGLWDSASGRGEDIRCSAKALDAVGFRDYRIIDLSSGQVLYPNGQIAPNRGLHVDINIVHHNADTATEDWIALRHRDISADRTIGYWAWELEHLPRSWHHAFSFYDEIWAATKFAYRAFYQPRLRSVRLVPMTVTSPQPKAQTKGILNIPDDHTIFLFIFDYRSHIARKNPLAVIEAFARAFPTFKEPTALVIKTLGAEASPSDRQTLEEATAHDPRIRLIDATLNRNEIASVVGAADAFVSLHRSEGFGRGPAEAMLLGVPVIVTDYSGTADFANNQTALTVPHNLIPVSEDDYPGVDGQRWADPDIDVAARHMRFVHDNPLAAKALGARGRKHLRRLYAPKRVGRRMLSVLKLTPDSILTTEPVSAA